MQSSQSNNPDENLKKIILMKSLLVNMEFHLKKKVKEPWRDRGIRRS